MHRIAGAAALLVVLLSSSATTRAADLARWMTRDEVAAEILRPKAVWCFEPEDEDTSCSFLTVNVRLVDYKAHYYVAQTFSPTRNIVSYVDGALDADGILCEQTSDYRDNFVITGNDGAIMAAEYAEAHAYYIDVMKDDPAEWCYRYARAEEGGPAQYLQVRIGGDGRGEEALLFAMGYVAGSQNSLSLR